jgi:hypothetical protein
MWLDWCRAAVTDLIQVRCLADLTFPRGIQRTGVGLCLRAELERSRGICKTSRCPLQHESVSLESANPRLRLLEANAGTAVLSLLAEAFLCAACGHVIKCEQCIFAQMMQALPELRIAFYGSEFTHGLIALVNST